MSRHDEAATPKRACRTHSQRRHERPWRTEPARQQLVREPNLALVLFAHPRAEGARHARPDRPGDRPDARHRLRPRRVPRARPHGHRARPRAAVGAGRPSATGPGERHDRRDRGGGGGRPARVTAIDLSGRAVNQRDRGARPARQRPAAHPRPALRHGAWVVGEVTGSGMTPAGATLALPGIVDASGMTRFAPTWAGFAGSPDDNNAKVFFDGAMDVLKPKIADGTLKVVSGQTDFNQAVTQGWKAENAQKRMDTCSPRPTPATPPSTAFSPNDVGPRDHHLGEGRQSRSPSSPVRTPRSSRSSRSWPVSSTPRSTRTPAPWLPTPSRWSRRSRRGEKPNVNDEKSYNNGVKVVPANLLAPVIVTKANAAGPTPTTRRCRRSPSELTRPARQIGPESSARGQSLPLPALFPSCRGCSPPAVRSVGRYRRVDIARPDADIHEAQRAVEPVSVGISLGDGQPHLLPPQFAQGRRRPGHQMAARPWPRRLGTTPNCSIQSGNRHESHGVTPVEQERRESAGRNSRSDSTKATHASRSRSVKPGRSPEGPPPDMMEGRPRVRCPKGRRSGPGRAARPGCRPGHGA